jgi:hypothetical protein
MDKVLKVKITDKIKKEAEVDPELKYINQYNTGLTPDEFKKFYSWAKNKYGSHDNILREMGAYDIQGAWKLQNSGKSIVDPNTGHGPDTFKKPNHITFSNQSQYHNEQMPGGSWFQQDNKWKFKPSQTIMQHYTKPQLQEYFNKNEKDVDLLFD